MADFIIDDKAKEILQESIYSGIKYIDSNGQVTLGASKYAQVSKADTITSENIKEDVEILGVTGTYSGGGQPVNWLKVVNNSHTYFKGDAAGYSSLIFNVNSETTETIENINKYSDIRMYIKDGAEDYNFIFSGKYKHQEFDNIYLNYANFLLEPEKTSESYYLWNFKNGDYGTITITHK